MPDEPEAVGLLALLLLTDARRDTREDDDGDLVLLADQDRTRWDQAKIAEGHELVRRCLRRNQPGAYQIQAAIAAVHADAATAAAHRLGADPGPLRPAALVRPDAGGAAQPGGRPGRGGRARRGAGRGRPARPRRSTCRSTPPGPTCCAASAAPTRPPRPTTPRSTRSAPGSERRFLEGRRAEVAAAAERWRLQRRSASKPLRASIGSRLRAASRLQPAGVVGHLGPRHQQRRASWPARP